MPASAPPTNPEDQLRWLVDRAAISDLLIEFARALDDKDWEAYAQTYAEDGVLALLPTVNHSGRAGLPEFASSSLGKFVGTHHLSSNHAIEIAGDVANTRSYLVAAHMLEPEDPSKHADVAGWYRCKLRRTPEGWRFTYVTLDIRYASGEPLEL